MLYGAILSYTTSIGDIMAIGLGVRKFTKNGSNGAKIHFTAQDVQIIKWRFGSLIQVEYDKDSDSLIVKKVQ